MTTTLGSAHNILPPPDPPGPSRWIRENLFGSLLNTILTILSVGIIFFSLTSSISWIFTEANWEPVSKFVILFLIGPYPRAEMWRVGLSLSIAVFLLGISSGKWGDLIRSISITLSVVFLIFAILPINNVALNTAMRLYLAGNSLVGYLGFLVGRQKFIRPGWIGGAWLVTPFIIMALFGGFENSTILPRVITTSWGGLMVTLLLAFGGILLSFPIGIALALGRRSKLPVVSAISTGFIEAVRGVPLVTILFMFSIILALFLPEDARLDRLFRALLAVTFFSSAYMAENIRGGLQSIPPGQAEAAQALGMSKFQTMFFIIMPQALKAVIPTIAGQFIGLFKDTTLVVIIGINDFLGIGKSILSADPAYILLSREVYLFVALIYWIFSFLMSLASRRIEFILGTGRR